MLACTDDSLSSCPKFGLSQGVFFENLWWIWILSDAGRIRGVVARVSERFGSLESERESEGGSLSVSGRRSGVATIWGLFWLLSAR
jgi:hypothetical protein